MTRIGSSDETPGICSDLGKSKGRARSPRSRLKNLAILIANTPQTMRSEVHDDIKSLDKARFLRFLVAIENTILKKENGPPQVDMDAVGTKMKTRLSPHHEFRNLDGKLRGDTAFDILNEGQRFTQDPPFEECFKLELQQLLCDEPPSLVKMPSNVSKFVSDVDMYRDLLNLLKGVLRCRPPLS